MVMIQPLEIHHSIPSRNAIHQTCVVENLDEYRNISVLMSTQAAVKAFHDCQINSELVLDCCQSLVQLAEHNKSSADMGAGSLGYWR
jgi:hypothetical protein